MSKSYVLSNFFKSTPFGKIFAFLILLALICLYVPAELHIIFLTLLLFINLLIAILEKKIYRWMMNINNNIF